MRRRLKTLSLGLVLMANLLTVSALAQEKPGAREREALRRSQQQVQQIRQEKTALEEKLSAVEKENAAVKLDKDKLTSQVGSAQARVKSESTKSQQIQIALDAVTLEKQTLQTQKLDVEKRLAEISGKLAAVEKELALNQADKKQALATLVTRDQQVATCETKNVTLYRHGRDLIDQCRDRSATDAVLRIERFTGIRRVEIENLLEEYRDRLDAQKMLPGEIRN